MASKLEQALDLARRGFYLFPLDPITNTPTAPWREASTRNEKTITNWFIDPITGWNQDPNFAIDCAKSGVTVIDVDVKNGKKGKESFLELEAQHESWGSPIVSKTPSGGLHLIYAGGGFKNSVEALAPGIDVRGEGGFIVAPGSTKGEKSYSILKGDHPPAPPEWLAAKLQSIGRAVPVGERDSGRTIVSDEADDLAWAEDYLQTDAAVPDEGGRNNAAYLVACTLKERGVGLQNAISLIEEHWNSRLDSPIDSVELETTVSSAYKSAQNATGAKSAHAEFEVPEEAIAAQPSPYAEISLHGDLLPDANSFPKRDWVIPGFALAQNVTGVIAPPGVGKSTFSLGLTLSTVSGVDILAIPARERCAVAVFNNEDTKEEQMRRLVAAAQCYNITNDMLSYPDVTEKGSMMFINGRDTHMLKIAKRDSHGRLRSHKIKELVEWLKARDIRMLIVDPLSMTHEGDENNNGEMLLVTSLYAQVGQLANCAVVLVHHTRKLSEASSEGHSGNLDSARGASSFGGAVRVAFTLNTMSTKDAEKYHVPDERRKFFILLEQAKANMSAPGTHRIFYERHGEIIGINEDNIDGESVGVLRPANFVDVVAETMSSTTRELVGDMESLLEDGSMMLSEIAHELINSFAMHSNKKQRSLERQLQRLFSENVLTGIKGVMHVEEMRGKRYVSLKLKSPATLKAESLI